MAVLFRLPLFLPVVGVILYSHALGYFIWLLSEKLLCLCRFAVCCGF